ncbi:MAG: endonuclease domain-containing protein [Planctomycetia bacterium]|nr:endonuclease domain-containing protein [Planctomycetia bacterium]
MHDQHPSAPRSAIARARQLRCDSTIPERILWELLRGGRLKGLKFRRQHPIAPYFVDFYCHDAKLVVELDGISHNGRDEEDQRREAFLRRQGLCVLRIRNDDVLQNLDGVAEAILKASGSGQI